MFSLIGTILLGIGIGWLLRSHPFRFTQLSITLLVWLLLFALGLEIGADREVMAELPTLGGKASIIALLSILGASTLGYLLWRVKRGDKGMRVGEETIRRSVEVERSSVGSTFLDKLKQIWLQAKDNLRILLIFFAGLLAGKLQLMPTLVDSSLPLTLLYFLLFFVGFSIGNSPSTLQQFRQIPRWHLLLPFGTIVGTLLGGLVAHLFIGGHLPHTLAVSGGQAYYSLSSVILTSKVGPALGAMALLSNVLRELITVLFAPLIHRTAGPLATIAAGGATTMDVSLPFILRACGSQYLVTSIYHGFVCDLSVPFVVTLLASL